MSLIKTRLLLLFCLPVILSGLLQAEEKAKPKIEDTIPIPEAQKDAAGNLENLKRARLTEEQAVNQLKYMMVKGWARMEKDLLTRGMFPPFGLVLSPDGEFRPLYLAEAENVKPEFTVAAITKNLKAIAQTRSMWAVGLMYITEHKLKDGTKDSRIMVMTEHIAGWARHWSYPFKIVNGEVKLGQPTETKVKPVYYVQAQ